MSNLAIYQEDIEEITRMRETLQRLMPGGTRFTPEEAESVARVAVMHGLDPFNGEVWGLKGRDGKWYGVMVGIKGLRKHARNQLTLENGSYWTEFVRVSPEKYGEPKTSLVYECILRDTVLTQAYTKAVSELRDTGLPWEAVTGGLGPMPKTIGVGIFNQGERTMMKPDAVAKKRAEADAIRQRFDVTFAQYAEPEETLQMSPGNGNDIPMIRESSEPTDVKQILEDIGYNPEDYTEGEFNLVEPEEDHGPFASAKTNAGTPFFTLDMEQLIVVMDVMKKRIDELGEINEDNVAARDNYLWFIDAADYYLDLLNQEEEMEAESEP